MKRHRLSIPARDELYDKLAQVRCEAGDFEVTVDDGDYIVTAKGSVCVDGYTEDGTGAWIETRREARVTVTAYDEDGTPSAVDGGEFYEYLNN